MKILVICQYYYPEPFRISDICEEFVKRGHSVTVITGQPNYPMGKIYAGYQHGKKRDEVINGVRVHRCFTIGRRSGIVCRLLNYYSYTLSSSAYVSRLAEDFDVVFVNQLSPVMMASAGIRYKKKHKKKLVLYCLDLWPESLVAGGIKRDSIIYKWFHRISSRVYRAADQILVTSKSFSDYFQNEFEISDVAYLPQYAESLFTPTECRKEPNGYIDLMFAGNVGKAQNVQTIIEAANLTRDIANLRWHIVGDGSELENIKKLAEKLNVTSVIFHGRQKIEDMPKYYAMADAMLVTLQKDPMLSLTLPGKVQTYMAAGKPIIAAADGEIRKVLNEAQCGMCSKAEDIEALANNVTRFIQANRQGAFSQNGNQYSKVYFAADEFMSKLEEQLRVGLI